MNSPEGQAENGDPTKIYDSGSTTPSNYNTKPGSLPSSDLDKASSDPEKAMPPQDAPQPPADPNLVGWDGPDDPENPMNWNKNIRWMYTVLLGKLQMDGEYSLL